MAMTRVVEMQEGVPGQQAAGTQEQGQGQGHGTVCFPAPGCFSHCAYSILTCECDSSSVRSFDLITTYISCISQIDIVADTNSL
jgi:hypothetical protein